MIPIATGEENEVRRKAQVAQNLQWTSKEVEGGKERKMECVPWSVRRGRK